MGREPWGAVTVENSSSVAPVSPMAGYRRYSFLIDGSRSLMRHCESDLGRHSFVSNSRAAGPNVFHRCRSTRDQADIGPHARWNMGLLFDNVAGGQMRVWDRGHAGSGQGWSGNAIVFWNCVSLSSLGGAAGFSVSSPRGGANYCFGCVSDAAAPYKAVEPDCCGRGGLFESSGARIAEIDSLYEAQLAESRERARQGFTIRGSQILKDGRRFVPRGVNAMSCYGAASGVSLPANLSIVREYVIMSKQPIEGTWASQISTGSWLHPLVPLLDRHAADGLVTILDLHRWNETSEAQFWAKVPSRTPYYSEYLQMLIEVYVPLVRGRPDVWLSVWNEPFMWDGSDGITGAEWAIEFAQILQAVRGAGLTNVVVVPVARMGQDESVLLTHGRALAHTYGPVLYDVHAYERWFADSPAEIRRRLAALNAAGVAVVVGEVGPSNAGHLMSPWAFLDEVAAANIGAVAWIWKCRSSATDRNAMRICGASDALSLNDEDNFGWASGFLAYVQRLAAAPAPSPSLSPPPGAMIHLMDDKATLSFGPARQCSISLDPGPLPRLLSSCPVVVQTGQ